MKFICRYEKSKCIGSQPPPFLAAFLDLLIEFHGEGTMVIVLELLSAPDTHAQLAHEDCVLYAVARKRRAFVDVPFSVIVALEDDANRTAIINENSSELLLPQGNFAMWRGNYEHAGASYNQVNRRLFIGIIHKTKASLFNFVRF